VKLTRPCPFHIGRFLTRREQITMYTAMKPQTQVVQSNNEQTFIVMGTLTQVPQFEE
jgi:hypothetical protein